MANRYDLEILIRTRKEGKGIEQADKEVEGLGKRLEGTLGVLKASAGAAIAAGVTFKKAFDLAHEGAQVQQLTESFNRMNEAVFKTPDLLEQMRDAARGTIPDVELMQGLLKLTAGTSDELGQQFAAAAPRLLEIAKASNKLNPSLGDTAFLYDSIATGIKRASPLILDNLGIVVKVGEANEKYAESIGKTVAELTAEEKQIALLNATMAAGDQLIQQVGGNVDSQADAFARLEVQVGSVSGQFKNWLAEGLLPVVQTLNSDYGTAVDTVIEKNIDAAKSIEDLIAEGQKIAEVSSIWGGFGAAFTGTADDIRQGAKKTLEALAVASGSFEEYQAAAEKAFEGAGPAARAAVNESLNRTFYDQARVADVAARQLAEYEARGAALAAQQAALAPAVARTSEEIRQQHQEMSAARGVNEDLADKTAQMATRITEAEGAARMANAANREYFEGLRETSAALREQAESQADSISATANSSLSVDELQQAHRRALAAIREYQTGAAGAELSEADRAAVLDSLTAALGDVEEAQKRLAAVTGDYFSQALKTDGAIGFFNETAAEMQDRFVTIGGLTAEQKEQMGGLQSEVDRLQAAYDRAAQSVRDYELRIKGANLEDDKRAEKIAEQQQVMAAAQAEIGNLTVAMGPYLEVSTQVVGVAGQMTINQDAVNQAIFEAADAQGASAEQLAILGRALGLYSDEAVEAALRTALIQAKINELTQAYIDGEISVADMRSEVNDFIAGLDAVPEPANTATGAIREAKEAADEFAGDYTATVSADTSATESALERLKRLMQGIAAGGVGVDVTVGAGGRAAGGAVKRGGLYQVGEGNAPELMATSQGLFMIPGDNGRVFSHQDSERMLGGSHTSGPITIQNVFQGPVEPAMLPLIANAQQAATRQAVDAARSRGNR